MVMSKGAARLDRGKWTPGIDPSTPAAIAANLIGVITLVQRVAEDAGAPPIPAAVMKAAALKCALETKQPLVDARYFGTRPVEQAPTPQPEPTPPAAPPMPQVAHPATPADEAMMRAKLAQLNAEIATRKAAQQTPAPAGVPVDVTPQIRQQAEAAQPAPQAAPQPAPSGGGGGAPSNGAAAAQQPATAEQGQVLIDQAIAAGLEPEEAQAIVQALRNDNASVNEIQKAIVSALAQRQAQREQTEVEAQKTQAILDQPKKARWGLIFGAVGAAAAVIGTGALIYRARKRRRAA
jgi:hypothetical protein